MTNKQGDAMYLNQPCQVLISVIIPCYNTGRYLDECFQSMLVQTEQRFEIIAIDDGSTDDTLEILTNLQQKDSRIKVLAQKNTKATIARINAEKQATGKYLLFLDNDDKLHPQFMEKCLTIVYTGLQHFGKRSDVLIPKFPTFKTVLLIGSIYMTSLINRSTYHSVGGLDPNINFFEGWELYIRLIAQGYDYKLIKEPLFYYRKRLTEDSLCDVVTYQQQEEAWLYIHKKHLHLYHNNKIYINWLASEYSMRYFKKRNKYSRFLVKWYYKIFRPQRYQRLKEEFDLL